MWEVDKDRFIDRYEQQKPNAAQFDSDIGRYTEVANNVQVQESVSSVHFIVVNAVDLKKAVIEHCIAWQGKLCALLNKLTEQKINDVYVYMSDNGEL